MCIISLLYLIRTWPLLQMNVKYVAVQSKCHKIYSINWLTSIHEQVQSQTDLFQLFALLLFTINSWLVVFIIWWNMFFYYSVTHVYNHMYTTIPMQLQNRHHFVKAHLLNNDLITLVKSITSSYIMSTFSISKRGELHDVDAFNIMKRQCHC